MFTLFNHPSISKRIALTVSAGAFVVIASGCATAVTPTPSPSASVTSSASATPTSTATLSPTTSATPSGPPATATAADVKVEVLNARLDSTGSRITVSAMITDRISNAGSCTLTVVAGGQTHTTTGPARADASVTYCGTLSVALPSGETGPWTYTVAYVEDGYRGVASGNVS